MNKLNKLTKFLEGISSIICLFPEENKRQVTLPSSTVYDALKSDWENIGLDMWKAYRIVESQQLAVNHCRNKNDQFDRSPRQHL